MNSYIERAKELKRSHNYRERYFEAKPGHKLPGTNWSFYFCPYCGRVVSRKKASVDHIYSVRKVQTDRALRAKFKGLEDGVNNLNNLVACCRKCNSRKGRKGGLWILRGKYGIYFMPALRVAVYVALVAVVWWLWQTGLLAELLPEASYLIDRYIL